MDEKLPKNVVLIGDKDIVNYAVAANTALVMGNVVILKARGMKVCKLFDIIEFLKHNFGLKLIIVNTKTSTDSLMSTKYGEPRNITALEVIVAKEEVIKEVDVNADSSKCSEASDSKSG